MVKRVFILGCIVSMVIIGCAAPKPPKSIKEVMREAYFKYHPELSPFKKNALTTENIHPEFSCADVILAWGWPDYKSLIDNGRIQIWSYEVTYSPPRLLIFEDGRLKKEERRRS